MAFRIISSGLFLILLGASQTAAEEVKAVSSPNIAITVSGKNQTPGSPETKRLETAGREILERLFAEDIRKSRSVSATVALIGPEAGGLRFELKGLFLYRQTYTAVSHEVEFLYFENSYVIQLVDGKPWRTSGAAGKSN